MPVHVRKKGEKFRVTEPSGRLAKSKNGKPIDGGGHESREKAKRQQAAVNSSKPRK